MHKTSLVILGVLLCYVSVLNFVVASFLYRRYVTVPRSRRPLNTSSLVVQDAADRVRDAVLQPAKEEGGAGGSHEEHKQAAPAAPLECVPSANTDVAVRLRRLATSESNAVETAPAVRLLSLLRARLLANDHAQVRVWLVMSPTDFLALFRLWCVALVSDSRGRCRCEILFTEAAQQTAISWLLAHRVPCAERLFLLDETFELPNFARFELHNDSVGRASAEARQLLVLDATPAPRGRESLLLPGCFLRECVRRRCRLAPGLQVDTDVADFAGSARADMVCRG